MGATTDETLQLDPATDGDLASDQAMGQKPSALVNLKHLI